MNFPDDGYWRNTSFAINKISTFLLLSRSRYFCCWAIGRRWYHPPSRQCCGSDMLY